MRFFFDLVAANYFGMRCSASSGSAGLLLLCEVNEKAL